MGFVPMPVQFAQVRPEVQNEVPPDVPMESSFVGYSFMFHSSAICFVHVMVWLTHALDSRLSPLRNLRSDVVTF